MSYFHTPNYVSRFAQELKSNTNERGVKSTCTKSNRMGKHDNLSLEQEHIVKIICNEIRLAPEEALHLPIPKTDRVTSR